MCDGLVRVRKSRTHFAFLVSAIAAAVPVSGVMAQEVDKALQERIDQEKADRRSCKVAICDIARNHKTEGPDVACSVVRTWTADELKGSVLKGRLDWPWSHAQCKADIKLERKMLAQALAGATVEGKLAKHAVACTLDQKGGPDKYTISFAITPTVAFASGKATRATLNWTEIQGSALAKGAVWSVATLDNNVGVFEGAVVEEINS